VPPEDTSPGARGRAEGGVDGTDVADVEAATTAGSVRRNHGAATEWHTDKG
jgi:hypothetical protein